MKRVVIILVSLLALTAVGFAAFRFWESRRKAAIEQAINAILKMGGKVQYEGGRVTNAVIGAELTGLTRLTRSRLALLNRFDALKTVNLSGSKVTDDDLQF